MTPTGKTKRQNETAGQSVTLTPAPGTCPEEALLADCKFTAAVLDTVGAVVIVLDVQGRIRHVNKACESLSGYTSSELHDHVLWDILLPPEEIEAFGQSFIHLLAGEAPSRYEGHWHTRSGETRRIAWSNTVLRNASEEVEYIIGTGIDITEQRHAQELARNRRLELARLQRLYTAGQLTTALAHEINQPLAAIVAYSGASLELLSHARTGNAQLVHNLEQIALQAQRASEVIRALRKTIRMEAPQEERLEVSELLQGALALVQHEARRSRITIRITQSPEITTVAADRVQIEQVLVNLLLNAIESIRNAGMVGKTIAVKMREADGMALITVRDNGPGIDAGLTEKIFEPFFTTKPEGLGMGLSICRSIVEAHGGRLWAERQAQGCAFHFTLPFAP